MARSKGNKDYLKIVADGVKGLTTVSEMEELRYVPTLLSSYNRATGVGGHPLGCLALIHGPNQVGKSALGLAILESLRRAGHPTFVVDTEFAAEKKWYESISPHSGFKQTESMNEVHDDIQRYLANLAAGKKAKKIPKDVGVGIMVDTLTPLLPDEVLEEIRKKGPERSYPIQANFISVWMKSLIPQVARMQSTVIMVLQERVAMNAKPFQKDYKLTGGKAIEYDNRLRMRVTSAKKLKVGDDVVGFQSRFTVENNKFVGTSMEKGLFFTANGKEAGVPKGLDLVREVLAECNTRKWVQVKGKNVSIRADKKELVAVQDGTSGLRKLMRDNAGVMKRVVDALNREGAKDA